jgi:hypothetical protein
LCYSKILKNGIDIGISLFSYYGVDQWWCVLTLLNFYGSDSRQV